MAAEKSELTELIAMNIRNFRTEKGYSQLELSLKCGISQSYLAEVETCKKAVSIKKLDVIARGLEKPIYLFFMNARTQTAYDSRMLLEYIQNTLPTEVKDITDSFLKSLDNRK